MIRLWDVATRRPLGAPLPATGPTDLAFSSDNRTLVAGGTALERSSGLRWATTPDAITERVCAVVGAPSRTPMTRRRHRSVVARDL